MPGNLTKQIRPTRKAGLIRVIPMVKLYNKQQVKKGARDQLLHLVVLVTSKLLTKPLMEQVLARHLPEVHNMVARKEVVSSKLHQQLKNSDLDWHREVPEDLSACKDNSKSWMITTQKLLICRNSERQLRTSKSI